MQFGISNLFGTVAQFYMNHHIFGMKKRKFSHFYFFVTHKHFSSP